MRQVSRPANIDIQSVTQDLVDAVAAVHEAENQRPADRAYIQQCVSGHPSAVALSEGRVAGFAYTRTLAPDLLLLSNILVAADFRGLGIGTRLLQYLEQEASRDWSSILLSNSDLWEHPPRRSPIEFYLKHGYQKIWQTPNTQVMAKLLGS